MKPKKNYQLNLLLCYTCLYSFYNLESETKYLFYQIFCTHIFICCQSIYHNAKNKSPKKPISWLSDSARSSHAIGSLLDHGRFRAIVLHRQSGFLVENLLVCFQWIKVLYQNPLKPNIVFPSIYKVVWKIQCYVPKVIIIKHLFASQNFLVH